MELVLIVAIIAFAYVLVKMIEMPGDCTTYRSPLRDYDSLYSKYYQRPATWETTITYSDETPQKPKPRYSPARPGKRWKN